MSQKTLDSPSATFEWDLYTLAWLWGRLTGKTQDPNPIFMFRLEKAIENLEPGTMKILREGEWGKDDAGLIRDLFGEE